MGTKTEKITDSSFISEVRKTSTNPKAEINAADFVMLIEAVETAYAADTPQQILTRVRQHYYPGSDPIPLKFDTLIPDAPISMNVPLGNQTISHNDRRILRVPPLDASVFQSITAKADENGKEDNPSPYLIDADQNKVDVGHAFLGLDALLHQRTANPYLSFGIENIDPASWVADLALAAYWTESDGDTAPKVWADTTNKSAAFNVYYYMSAPDEDLLGDADSFGLLRQWNTSKAANGGIDDKLSKVLRAYYLGAGGAKPLVSRRWRIFCEVNQFDYAVAGVKVNWGNNALAKYIPRIDRLCDLFKAGITGLATTPPPAKWAYSLAAFRRFQDFIAVRLEGELRVP